MQDSSHPIQPEPDFHPQPATVARSGDPATWRMRSQGQVDYQLRTGVEQDRIAGNHPEVTMLQCAGLI